jgi:hypothetical protein
MRMNLSETFVSLARRSQKLVDKIIAGLDQIERDEDRADKLNQLFELDHLATRMRRNDENLLILAGVDASAPRLEDAMLADVLAAAQSEIARYERVEIGALNLSGEEEEAIAVKAAAVNDVVRLFAELLENAASFSPPTSRVLVAARLVGDRVLVEIEDRGIGMTQKRRDELNQRLEDPNENRLGSMRMMGFSVVGKLAQQHGIRVHLGIGRGGGTVVHVMLPPTLVSVSKPALAAVANLAPAWVAIAADQLPPAPAVPNDRPAPPRGPVPPSVDSLPHRQPSDDGPERKASRGRDTGIFSAIGARNSETAQFPLVPPDNEWFASPTARVADDQAAPDRPSPRRAGRPSPGRPSPGRTRATAAGAPAPGTTSWLGATDPGWQAAARANKQARATSSREGLPRRDPMAQLVPGSFTPMPEEIPRTAAGIRSFLNEYQRGVRNGRHENTRGQHRTPSESQHHEATDVNVRESPSR